MSGRRLRVLLVAAATSVTGGGERHVADLMERLPHMGVDVGLVAPAGGDLAAMAGHAGIPFHRAEIGKGFSLQGLAQLRSAISTFDPDVVHAHGARAAFYARLADAEASRRVVYTLHGIHVDKAGSAARQRALLATERLLKRRTAAFITVSEADRRTGGRLGMIVVAASTVIHNGVVMPLARPVRGAFRAELGIAPDVPLVLSVGRFEEPKDQRTLVTAWAEVLQRMPEAVLALIGSGRREEELRALIASLDIGHSVSLLAPRPDLAPAYADADLFCLSSRWEGLPYVVLEAMSYGLPVVSTDVDGIPEVVTPGETGVLVAPGDPGALADAVFGVLGDADHGRRMGVAGARIVAERFSLDRMVEGIVQVYRRVASGDYRSQSSS